MTNEPHSEQPNCTDDEIEVNILPPDAHDLIEIDQELIWEIRDSAAYTITEECRRDGCQGQYYSLNIVGKTITTVQDLKLMTYQIYDSYFENPRGIPYPVLQSLIDIPDLEISAREGMASNLNNSARLGCSDADRERSKRTHQEVYDAVLPDEL